MIRRALSVLALAALAAAGALVPTTASAADSASYARPQGVVFTTAEKADVAITYTCANTDEHVSTEDLHVRVSQSIEVVAEDDVAVTCDGTERQVDAEVVVDNEPFVNGTAFVFLTIGAGAQQQFDEVPVSGVPEQPANARLAVTDGIVRFSSATQAVATVDYTCATADSTRDDTLHVSVWQPRATAYEASASNFETVPVRCDGAARSVSVDLTVEGGTFVNGAGSPNAEAWLSLDGESNVVTQDVEVRGVPAVDHRATVALTVDATPEPAIEGKKITVKGVIKRSGKAYGKQKVVLEFRPDGDEYATVKTVTSSKKGALSTTVVAEESGSFRWVSAETRSTKAGQSSGDHVEVEPAPEPLPKPKAYKNCTALRKVYPHGVGKKGAQDETSGDPVTTFTVDSKTYAKNKKSDRDKDGIACEQA